MTGEKCSDMSDSSGSLWLDIKQRNWSIEALKATDLSIKQMPNIVEGSEISGKLKKSIADDWGIDGRPVVAGGGGDNAATACGLGIIKHGDAFISLGTSGVIFLATDNFIPAANYGAHSFCHAIPEKWHLMSVILSATDSLNWLSEILCRKVSEMMEDLDHINQGPSDLMFHPYLFLCLVHYSSCVVIFILSFPTTSLITSPSFRPLSGSYVQLNSAAAVLPK